LPADMQTWWLVLLAAALGFALLVRALRSRVRPTRLSANREEAEARARRPPRSPHERFVHVLLRDVALSASPGGGWETVVAPDGVDVLEALWRAAHGEGDETISPAGIRVEVEDDVAVVTVPPPARVGEAYMAAVVRAPPAYFVLERGPDAAFVTEWRGETRTRLPNVRLPTSRDLLEVVRRAQAERRASAP
jgi:hypothetical protein